MTPGRPHIIVARTSYGHNALGNLGPITEFAVVDLSTSAPLDQLHFSSRLNRDGMTNYNLELSETDEFDLDFRDPGLDGEHAFAAGYMMLGHIAIPYGHFVTWTGAIHAIEAHNQTLGDDDVLDVVRNMAMDISPNYNQTGQRCRACVPGTQDKDSQTDTECVSCEVGKYSDQPSAISCEGRCSPGSTILEAGAASGANCTQCAAGQYGPVADADNTLVCRSCLAGQNSPEAGGQSVSDCVQCAEGQYSASGAAECNRSGCTDIAARNHDLVAVIDNGSCEYTCAELRMRAGYTNPNGGCIIDVGGDQGWTRFAANGTVIGTDKITDVPLGESWVVQGKPLPGSSSSQPLCSDYGRRLDITGNVTARYITIQNLEEEFPLGGALRVRDGGYLRIEHANLLNNDNTEVIYRHDSQPPPPFLVFSPSEACWRFLCPCSTEAAPKLDLGPLCTIPT